VQHVVSFDPPYAAEDVVHRAGRTARSVGGGCDDERAVIFISHASWQGSKQG
jgi:superfamily II DNA/RNA helicase